MRLHIIYDTEGWAYHRRALALQRYAPLGTVITFGKYTSLTPDARAADLVYLMAYGACRDVREYIGPNALLVCGYNVGAGYRRERYEELSVLANHVIFNNLGNWDCHNRPPSTTWISNGVDRKIFKPVVPLQDRTPLAISTGSQYHLLHNCDLKGVEILEHVSNKLRDTDIECDFRVVNSTRPPMTADEMAAWYNSATVYVVASRHEGTPNPALEAASCGCTLVATRVGNMPELIEHGINGLLVERDVNSITQGIIEASQDYQRLAGNMQESIAHWDWSIRARQYYSLFQRLIEAHQLAEAMRLPTHIAR